MNLTDSEDIGKSWQEYTEELHKKGLNDPDNHSGVVTHLELVKWALKSINTDKINGGDGISTEPFKILKDDAVKELH